MSADCTVIVDGVHLGKRVAVLEDGTTIPFETLIGSDGEETDEIDDAVSVVCPLPDGMWVTIDLTAFEQRRSN